MPSLVQLLSVALLAAAAGVQALPLNKEASLVMQPETAATDADTVDTYIVGGVEVSPKFKYPWLVALQYNGAQFCGGSLVSPRVVVTAAHCTGVYKTVTVAAHRHDLTKTSASEAGISSAVVSAIRHPQYGVGTADSNDIAVWILSTPIAVDTYASLDDGTYSKEGLAVITAGWGTTKEGGSSSSVLREVTVPITAQTTCKTAYGSYLDSTMICAAATGKDACQGDSGGPLFYPSTAGPKLVGIVSWGEGCARAGKPGVYARASLYVSWVKSYISLYP